MRRLNGEKAELVAYAQRVEAECSALKAEVDLSLFLSFPVSLSHTPFFSFSLSHTHRSSLSPSFSPLWAGGGGGGAAGGAVEAGVHRSPARGAGSERRGNS